MPGLLVLCWTVVVRVGILVLFLILREDCICCGLLIDGFYEIEVCFLYPYTLKSFNQEKMLYFVKCFFCINWEDHMVLASSVINVLYHTDSFESVEPHLHSRNKSHLVMMDNPFNILFDSIGQDPIEYFGIHFHQGYRSVILLFDGIFAWFWVRLMLASQNKFGSFPSVSIFFETASEE